MRQHDLRLAHQREGLTRRPRRKEAPADGCTPPIVGRVALVLACAAGVVDVVGYVIIERVYTANMTGNLVALGVRLARRAWSELALRATPLVSFLAGLVAASFLLDRAKQRNQRRALARPLLIVVFLLAAVALCGASPATWAQLMKDRAARDTLVACLAFAMGLQNASFTHVGTLVVRTTHVTGTMLKLSEALADYGLWLRNRSREAGFAAALNESRTHAALRHAIFFTGMVAQYLFGAVFGAILAAHWGASALALPAALVAAVAAADLVRPIPCGEHDIGLARRGGE